MPKPTPASRPPKARSGRFERLAARAQKSAIRQVARRVPHEFDFAALAAHPLYRRLEAAILDDDFKRRLEQHGFTSALDVARFKSLSELEEHARAQKSDAPAPNWAFYTEARRRARAVARQVRHAVALKDPTHQALRHATRHLPPPLERFLREDGAIEYARPESIQSDQSLAAYLKAIYDLARAHITHASPSFALDRRRPDLAGTVLSEDNIKKEIRTIDLVNEVLRAQVKQGWAADGTPTEAMTDAALETALRARFSPIALPFDEDRAHLRSGLSQIGSLGLNELAHRTRAGQLGIDDPAYTLTPVPWDVLDLLADGEPSNSLWGSEVALLSAGLTQQCLFTTIDLYGCKETDTEEVRKQQIHQVGNYCRMTDLSFDALCQLYRQYGAEDDAGNPASEVDYGASFFAVGPLRIEATEGGRALRVVANGSSRQQSPGVLRSMHFLARLYHRTGIPFHELDWLLQTPGATALGNADTGYDDGAHRNLLPAGFDLLAHFLDYRRRFEIGADDFAALLWRVNPYHRLDMNEESLLRRLFGDDAANVRTATLDGTTKLSEVDAAGATLGNVLRRGLRLSTTEWSAVAGRLDPSADLLVNEETLARLYRLSRCFRLLGWELLPGLALAEQCENGVLAALLAAPVDGAAVQACIRGFDQLVELAQWMKGAGLSAPALGRILTPGQQISQRLQVTEPLKEWLRGLGQAVSAHRVTEDDFEPFTRWQVGETLATIDAPAWFAALQAKGVLDAYGIVSSLAPAAIEQAVLAVLAESLSDATGQDAAPVTAMLLLAQQNQLGDLAGQVSQLGDGVKSELVGPMLLWMGQDSAAALRTLLAWDYPGSATALGGEAQRVLHHDLCRHAGLIGVLGLGPVEVGLAAEQPAWISPSTGGTSSLLLRRIFHLHQLETWQHAESTAESWGAYLVLANSTVTPDAALTAQLHAILALLLSCPDEDVVTWLGTAVPATVEALGVLVRRVRLSQELRLSAAELQAVLAAGAPAARDARAAARAAVQGALSRQDGTAPAEAAAHAVAERRRDALVGLFLSDKVSADADLAGRIRDTESLYEYLLLDVNAGSAVPTSRLVEACSSIQVHVHRALQGLEPGTSISDKTGLKQAWEIAQHYRVWEANQKLMRYPGNYIEPELRYKKSPIFQDLEAALGSGDLDEEKIQAAVYQYFESLQRVTELTVCGYAKEEMPGETLAFHVVARGNWEEQRYFYRRMVVYLGDARLSDPAAWQKALEWQPWQEIQISPTNPIVSDVAVCPAWNRLFFFWLELEETMDREGVSSFTLRPRYLRAKMNGLMGDVLSPEVTEAAAADIVLEVRPERIETVHPTFGTDSINLEYTLTLPAASRRFRFTVSSKSASFDIAPEGDPPEDQSVVGFRTMASLDPTATLGEEYEFVPSPSEVMLTFAKAQFDLDYRHSSMGTMHVSLEQDLKLAFRYVPGGTGGVLEIQVQPNRILGRYDGSMLDQLAGQSGRFTEGEDYITAVFWVLKDGEIINLDTEVPNIVQRDVQFDEAGGFRHDLLTPRLTFELSQDHWDPASGEPLSLSMELWTWQKGTWIDVPALSGHFGISNSRRVRTPSQFIYFTLSATPNPRAVAFAEEESLGCEGYLYFSREANALPTDSYVTLLHSQAMADLARSLPLPEGQSLSTHLFRIDNQLLAEGNVDAFYQSLYDELHTASTNGCRPPASFHFDGPFGLYGWEIFYHLPSLVASKYVEQGHHEAARRWLNAIYDPTSGQPWNVVPLRDGLDQSGEAHGGGIADPDDLAQDNPVYYQQATIRHSLEMMLAAGDSAYRKETQESLQQAKLCYVAGKQLFARDLGEDLETLTATAWSSPTLGAVTAADFRPPYNQEIRDLHRTFEERLQNLRQWLDMDGQPLHIPLLAAPIDPRRLQQAALASRAAPPKTETEQPVCPYSFDDVLAKAQGYVKQLQAMSGRLQDALEKKDDRELAQAIQAEAVAGFEAQIELQQVKLDMALKAKEIADAQLEQAVEETAHEESRKEILASNVSLAIEKVKLAQKNGVLNAKRIAAEASTLISSLIPKIAGLSFGGMAPETGSLGNQVSGLHEKQDLTSDEEKVQEEEVSFKEEVQNAYNAQQAARKMAELERAVEHAEMAVQQEEWAMELLQGQKASGDTVMELVRDRLTNAEFYGWYVGQLGSIYQASYDATVAFCRLAERALAALTGRQTLFVRPQWGGDRQALLAPDSLALDLMRMDLAYTQFALDGGGETHAASFSLSTQRTSGGQATVLEALLSSGEAVFELTEEMFDEYYPDQHDRRIQFVRVSFPDLARLDKPPYARLTQIGNSRSRSRRGGVQVVKNVLAWQSLSLSGAETDTRTMQRPGRRLQPFQGTGVCSTWRLSIPAVQKALSEQRAETAHHAMLKESVREIVLEIGFSART